MSNARLTIWSGIAPQGSVRTEWDWNEDEDGFRFRSEYDIIPQEAVYAKDELNLDTAVRHMSYAAVQQYAADYIMAMAGEGGWGADEELVIQFTVSDGTGMNFKASGWGTVQMALDFLAL